MKWIWNATAGLGMLLVSGCLLGPGYQRPAVDTGEAFRGAPAGAQEPSLADLPWWEVFGDEQLQAHIRVALEHNKDLQLAIARVTEARAVAGIVRGALFPQLFGSGQAARTRASEQLAGRSATVQLQSPGGQTTAVSLPSPDLYSNFHEAGVNAFYEVDLWGRLRRANEAARAELLATEFARETVTSALVAEVARTYFQLRELDLELEIAERTHRSRVESERLIGLREEYGRTTGLDLQRSRAETAATAATIATIKNGIAQTENAMSILLGQNPGSVARGRPLAAQPMPPPVPPGLSSALLERRPDILAAEAQLVASNARIGEAKALFFPQFDLTGFLGFQSDALNEWLEHNAHTWTIGANVAQPIFTGGRLLFNYRAAQARYEQALIAYLAAIQRALLEVADSLALQAYATEERLAREKQVAALIEAVGLSSMRYDAGRSDYLDVLDAEREQFDAELQLAQARFAELLGAVQLYRALGGGWQTPPQPE